jgi:urease accessory protein
VDALWCYSVTFGGGLVAGDRSGMSVTVADRCTAALATQGTTKVYKHNKPQAAAAATTTAGTAVGSDAATAYSDSSARTSRETVQAGRSETSTR